MKLAELQALADWHEQQAGAGEFLAANFEAQAERDGAPHLLGNAAGMRERAQWHASTAIHLRELADAFATFSQLTAIQP